MSLFDIFDEPDSFIHPTSSYEEMIDEIRSDKEGKKEHREGKSMHSFFKRLLE